MANIDKRTKKTDNSYETINRRVRADNELETSQHDRWGIFSVQWIAWKPDRRVVITIATWDSADEDVDGIPVDFEKKAIVLTGDDYRDYQKEAAGAVGDKLRLLQGKATRKAARAHAPKLIPPAPQCTDIDEPNPDPE